MVVTTEVFSKNMENSGCYGKVTSSRPKSEKLKISQCLETLLFQRVAIFCAQRSFESFFSV